MARQLEGRSCVVKLFTLYFQYFTKFDDSYPFMNHAAKHKCV